MTARVYSPETQCEGKHRYATKAEAKRAVKATERHKGERLMPYRCPHCGDLHLGHRPSPYTWPAEPPPPAPSPSPSAGRP